MSTRLRGPTRQAAQQQISKHAPARSRRVKGANSGHAAGGTHRARPSAPPGQRSWTLPDRSSWRLRRFMHRRPAQGLGASGCRRRRRSARAAVAGRRGGRHGRSTHAGQPGLGHRIGMPSTGAPRRQGLGPLMRPAERLAVDCGPLLVLDTVTGSDAGACARLIWVRVGTIRITFHCRPAGQTPLCTRRASTPVVDTFGKAPRSSSRRTYISASSTADAAPAVRRSSD
jgi:hypothetical protein